MSRRDAGLIYHCVGVRIRVTGSGLLRTSLHDLGVESSTLHTITMQLATGKFGNVIANFKSQKMQVEVKTTSINERFKISNIMVFTKPSSTGYPQI